MSNMLDFQPRLTGMLSELNGHVDSRNHVPGRNIGSVAVTRHRVHVGGNIDPAMPRRCGVIIGDYRAITDLSWLTARMAKPSGSGLFRRRKATFFT